MKKFILFLLGLWAVEFIGSLIYELITKPETRKAVFDFFKNLTAENKISMTIAIIIMVVFIVYIVLSIILYRKRHDFLGYENSIGTYIGLFIWTAFCIAPIWMLLPEIIKLIKGQQINYWLLLTPLYSVIPIILFIKLTKGTPIGERIGLFFYVLGVGITLPMFIIYKFFSIMLEPSSRKKEKTASSSVEKYPPVENNEISYYYEVGTHYDKYGSYTGYTNKDGTHYDKYGSYTGYTNKDGTHYDKYGSYTGYTSKDGTHYDKYGNYAGHTSKDGTYYDKYNSYAGHTSK